jgi:diphthine-ammonia ligase
VTIRPSPEHPYLFHRPNVQWVELQAKCAGVKHVVVDAGEGDAAEQDALKRALDGLPVQGVTSGALASEYQRVRIENVCHALGLKSFAPLWHHDPARHLRDLVQAGVDSLVVHVAAEGMGKEWLGRRLDANAAEELVRLHARKGVNPAGEGGEYETFVVDAPQFSHRVQIEESEGVWRRDAGTLTIRRARLAFKSQMPYMAT